jgi:hypothetical protein
MTLPSPWKRSTAKERRQQRAEFQALKAQVAGSQTAEKRKAKAEARGR